MDKSEMILTPRQWLKAVIKQSGMTQGSVARLIGRHPSQLSKWLHNKEPIPTPVLFDLGQIFCPGEYMYPILLKQCEDQYQELRREIDRFADNIGLSDHQPIEELLFTQLQFLLQQEADRRPMERTKLLALYLSDATFAIRSVHNWFFDRRSKPIISSENVVHFSRNPRNHLMGLVIGLKDDYQARNLKMGMLPDLQKHILNDLRSMAMPHQKDTFIEHLIQKHSVYTLGVYGYEHDREYLTRVILDKKNEIHPIVRRAAFIGVSIGGNDRYITDLFLYKLDHEDSLAHLDHMLDAIHYGDVGLDWQVTPPNRISRWKGAILHYLRHVGDPSNYGHFLDVDLHRLLHILDVAGAQPFTDPLIVIRLAKALKGVIKRGDSKLRFRFHAEFDRLFRDHPEFDGLGGNGQGSASTAACG